MTETLKNPIMRLLVEETIKNKNKDMAKEIQKTLRNLGMQISVDGDIGPVTISAIKKVSNKKLAADIIARRESPAQAGDPRWIKYAFAEMGVKEIRGKRGSNPRVEAYHDVAGIAWADDDVPWCASFVAFVMHKAGYKLPKHPAAALSWMKFGRRVSKPVYGAIAIKHRKGGGHVTFVVGVSLDGRYLYGLGGNQNDAVNIHRYPVSVFSAFVVPEDYTGKVKVASGISAAGGSIREA